MGFQYASVATKVEISGSVGTNLPVPSATQTIVHNISAATATAYTVPAGKTFYLMGVQVATVGTARVVQIWDNGGVNVILYFTLAATESQSLMSAIPLHVYTTTQVVTRDNNDAKVMVLGFLV